MLMASDKELRYDTRWGGTGIGRPEVVLHYSDALDTFKKVYIAALDKYDRFPRKTSPKYVRHQSGSNTFQYRGQPIPLLCLTHGFWHLLSLEYFGLRPEEVLVTDSPTWRELVAPFLDFCLVARENIEQVGATSRPVFLITIAAH